MYRKRAADAIPCAAKRCARLPGGPSERGALRWASAEPACLFLRSSARARQWKQKQEKKHGSGKALGILAARLARAVYHLLRKAQAFDEDRFWSGQAPQGQAPACPARPTATRASRSRARAAVS